MKETLHRIIASRWFIGAVCLIVGALAILGLRVAAYTPEEEVHYHANFAVYINGQREEFKAPNYYEEEAATACGVSEAAEAETTPMSRVHMHGNVNDVVHVEDSRVTWGNFFTVLGWNVGPAYLATRDALNGNDGSSKVTYILNGKEIIDANSIVRYTYDDPTMNLQDAKLKQELAAI